jgi:hypothetical protein
MGCTRDHWGWLATAALLCGCYEGPQDAASGEGPSSASETGAETDTDAMTGSATSGPLDCIPGQELCECLEGDCVGELHCVAEVCQPGPVFEELDGDFNVIGGVRLPINVEIMADSFEWTQVSGPDADALAGTDTTQLLVDVPAGANAGAQMVFRINAVRNTIEDTYDVTVNIMGAEFVDILAANDNPEEAGTIEGLGMLDFEAWVVSSEGFISRFNADGGFVERIDIPGAPMGGVFGGLPNGDDDEITVLYLANSMSERVQAVIQEGNHDVQMITDQMSAGGALGPVDSVVPVGGGELFFTNRTGGQVFHYHFADPDGDGNAEWMTEEFAPALGPNPNAIATGIDPGYIYVGTVGKVWRVPVLEGGVAGEAELYFDIGASDDPLLEVDGITFDIAGTMYVGVSGMSTLYMARYNGGAQVEATRTFTDVGGGVSAFANLQFGDGDFEAPIGDPENGESFNGTLYWTNPATSAVGRLGVGVEGD